MATDGHSRERVGRVGDGGALKNLDFHCPVCFVSGFSQLPTRNKRKL